MAKLHLDNHPENHKDQEKCTDIRDRPGIWFLGSSTKITMDTFSVISAWESEN